MNRVQKTLILALACLGATSQKLFGTQARSTNIAAALIFVPVLQLNNLVITNNVQQNCSHSGSNTADSQASSSQASQSATFSTSRTTAKRDARIYARLDKIERRIKQLESHVQTEGEALFNLALAYIKAKQYDKAHEQLILSSQQKHAPAQLYLAICYLTGDSTIPYARQKGFKLCQACAQQGDPWAKIRLAYLYGHGYGVSHDLKREELENQETSQALLAEAHAIVKNPKKVQSYCQQELVEKHFGLQTEPICVNCTNKKCLFCDKAFSNGEKIHMCDTCDRVFHSACLSIHFDKQGLEANETVSCPAARCHNYTWPLLFGTVYTPTTTKNS